jgi:glutamyl-tRNA synthetase
MHIRNLSREELTQRLIPFLVQAGYQAEEKVIYQAIPIIRERLVTLDDVIPVAGFLFKADIIVQASELIGDKLTQQQFVEIMRRSYQVLESLTEITKDITEPPMRELVEELNLNAGQVFGMIRVAVTGQKVSPPLFETMEIIGKDKVLQRLQKAIEVLENFKS